MEADQELQAARDKLAARFGNATQIGGKGTYGCSIPHSPSFWDQICYDWNFRESSIQIVILRQNLGTQRRKKKHVNVQNVNEDKKLKSAIKKFGMCEASNEHI